MEIIHVLTCSCCLTNNNYLNQTFTQTEMIMKKVLVLLLMAGFFGACEREFVTREDANGSPKEISEYEAYLDLPFVFYDYERTLPKYLQSVQMQPLPTDNGKATLGRVLFYDKKLSANHAISCASCHIQANGFSDPEVFSAGFEDGLTDRNSMGLSSARFYQRGRFFWDERAATLEIQTLQPIQHAVEMGMTPEGATAVLESIPGYEPMFKAACGLSHEGLPREVPDGRPVLRLEAAIDGTKGRLTCDSDQRGYRARLAITSLVTGGLVTCVDGWVWRS